jgi:hypothetical protein
VVNELVTVAYPGIGPVFASLGFCGFGAELGCVTETTGWHYLGVTLSVGSASVAEPHGPFLGLGAGDAVELGELLAFLSDWLVSDPNRLDASLHDFVGAPDYVGPVCRVDELRTDVNRFARMLLGYGLPA